MIIRFETTFGAKFFFAVHDFERNPSLEFNVAFLIFSQDSSKRLRATCTTHFPTILGSPCVSENDGLASIQKESLVLDGGLLYSSLDATPIPRIGNSQPQTPKVVPAQAGNWVNVVFVSA